MRLTVYCDASHHPRTRVGAFGCVIEGPSLIVRESGAFDGVTECPTQAEVRAALAAATLAVRLFPSATALLLLMDSKSAVRILRMESWFWQREKYKPFVDAFALLTEGKAVEFKYVRSHQGDFSHATRRNEECDRASKDARRKAEAERGSFTRSAKGAGAPAH